MGLALCFKYVQQNGGTIDFERAMNAASRARSSLYCFLWTTPHEQFQLQDSDR